jgi:hypothetical protein
MKIILIAFLDFDIEKITNIFKTIFSWAVLMPIAVIISGKLLAQPLKISIDTDQYFAIPIPKILYLRANGGEVILGFAGFIITLVLTAIIGGQSAYIMFRDRFGIDPGQFNSLCIFSSFMTVIWSVLIWLLTFLLSKAKQSAPDPVAQERDELIIKLAKTK